MHDTPPKSSKYGKTCAFGRSRDGHLTILPDCPIPHSGLRFETVRTQTL